MSKILISGCGLSWSKQERSTWTKVIRLCGVDIDDQAGPAISNQLILTSMIQAVMENDYSQAVCQLTSTEKLDVEVNNDSRKDLVAKDPIRNFTHKGYWPSSVSQNHDSKKMFYEYLPKPKPRKLDKEESVQLSKIVNIAKDSPNQALDLAEALDLLDNLVVTVVSPELYKRKIEL